MSRIFVPARGIEDWRRLLAKPGLQWRDGYSAKALARSWQSADGFPKKVRAAFDRSGIELFREIRVIFAMPEYQVSLESEVRPSQNDIFVLAESGDQLVSIMVEGKKRESFGPKVSEWREDASDRKKKRLGFLLQKLRLQDDGRIPSVRYQLLHRTASALLEAKRFKASNALMLVHSFSQTDEWLADYKDFLSLFGVEGGVDSIVFGKKLKGIDLYFGWVKGDQKHLHAPEGDE